MTCVGKLYAADVPTQGTDEEEKLPMFALKGGKFLKNRPLVPYRYIEEVYYYPIAGSYFIITYGTAQRFLVQYHGKIPRQVHVLGILKHLKTYRLQT